MLTKDLVEFGLSEKESCVYLALLELETASANEISKKTAINRSTSYVVIDSLIKKGFVTISNDKNVRQYNAVSPESILRSAEDMAIKYENIKNKIEKIVPEMLALHKDTKQKPVVKVYEGKQGLVNAFENTLKSREKFMRVYSSPSNLNSIIPNYLIEYVQKRFKLGIKMQGIHPDNEVHRNIMNMGPKKFDKYVLVPTEKYKFPADLAIYDDTIGYMTSDHGGLAVMIESKEVADVMKNIFDLALEEAKRLKTN